jgi:hypothetical protein
MAYCEWITLPDGTKAIVRFSGKRPAACRWCGKPSTKLCDFRLSHPSQVTHKRTCDAPMCDQHAKSVGTNLDFCPDHANKEFELTP